MRPFILSTVLLQTALLAPSVVGTRLLAVEVLSQCKQICMPIVELTKVCAIHTSSSGVLSAVGVDSNSSQDEQSGYSNAYKQRRSENPARLRYRRDADDEEIYKEVVRPRTFDNNENKDDKDNKGPHGKPDCNKPRKGQQPPPPPQSSVQGVFVASEQQCVCTNKSFNVVAVAGLCASCMRQYGSPVGNSMDQIMAACAFTSTVFVEQVATVFVQQISVVTITKVLEDSRTSVVVVPIQVATTTTQTEVQQVVQTVQSVQTLTQFAVQTVQTPGGFLTETRETTRVETQVVTQVVTQNFNTQRLITPAPFATQFAVSTFRAFSSFSQFTPSPSPTFLFATANAGARTEVAGGLVAFGIALLGLL